MRSICFTPNGFEDYVYWQTQDRKTLKRINRLLVETAKSPFEGIGKPEPLKHVLERCWSRRITGEHRLVYQVNDQQCIILAARYHYR